MPAKQAWVGLHVRATPAWLAWLRRLARHAGAPISEVVGRALAAFAASIGFDPPPPRY